MNPELWKQVDALLDAALELPPEEREQFVVEACEGNDELREEVLSLVRAQSQASGFMERSAMKVAAQALAQDSNLTTSFFTGWPGNRHLQDRKTARRRRHGRGLPGPRDQTQSPRRAQDSAARNSSPTLNAPIVSSARRRRSLR